MGWNKSFILWGFIPLLLLLVRDVLGFYTPYQAAQAHARALHNALTTEDQAPYEFNINHVLGDPSGKERLNEVEVSPAEDPAPYEFKIHKVREDPSWVDGVQGSRGIEPEKQGQGQSGAVGLESQGSQITQPEKDSQSQSWTVGLDDVTETSSQSAEDDFLEQPTEALSDNEPYTAQSSSLAVANNYYYFTMCDYGGEKYPVGSFRPDPCTNCHCNATTGRVTCTAQTCPPSPNCIEFAPNPKQGDSCCQPCAKVGCYYKGRAYPPGAKIDSGACEKCYCPWEGGDPETGAPTCMPIHCPAPRCVDADVPTDKCCPVCPNGPNCWLDHKVIPEGERIYIDKCRYCYCSNLGNISNSTHRQATCVRSFFCL